MNGLVKVAEGASARYDVVFIHGLDGDASSTWVSSAKLQDGWLAWLAADNPQIAVWSLGYDIKSLSWRGNTMPLPDRATNLLNRLVSFGIGKRPLMLICHSYGGLIAKQILRNAQDSQTAEYRAFVQNTRGVYFIATPHKGSVKADLSRSASCLNV